MLLCQKNGSCEEDILQHSPNLVLHNHMQMLLVAIYVTIVT